MSVKQMTITLALAEIKTLKQRIAKQAEFALANVAYPSALVDPQLPSGGSIKVMRETRQSIADMQQRVVLLRLLIAQANDRETLSLFGQTRTLAEWLIWKREVAPDLRSFLRALQTGINSRRVQASTEAGRINARQTAAPIAIDVTAAINEQDLAREIDAFEELYGALDGALSQRNSTILIDVPA